MLRHPPGEPSMAQIPDPTPETVTDHIRMWHGHDGEGVLRVDLCQEHHRLHDSTLPPDRVHTHYAAPAQPRTGHENEALKEMSKTTMALEKAVRIYQRGKTL